MMHPKLQYLVVGTGRSGTLYAAKLLTALGIPCGHERIFDSRDPAHRSEADHARNSACAEHFGLIDSGPAVAESSYMAAPFLEHELLSDSTIIHVVRDPLAVIRSFLNNLLFFRQETRQDRHPQEQFIYTHLPYLEELPDPISRACFFYLRWNQMIAEKVGRRPYVLYPIERGPQVLLDFLGRESNSVALPDDACNAYRQWPDHMRVGTDLPPVTDEEIQSCFLWKDVAVLAATYGYQHRTPERERAAVARPAPRAPFSKPLCYPLQPRLVQADFHDFNLVQYRDTFFAVHQALGDLDLAGLSAAEQDALIASGRLCRESSVTDLKAEIRDALRACKHEELLRDVLQLRDESRQALDEFRRKSEHDLRLAIAAIHRVQADLQLAFEALRQADEKIARLRPWYRKAAGRIRRLWRRLLLASSARFSSRDNKDALAAAQAVN